MRLRRHDDISSQVLDNGTLVGMALKLANGRWGAFDPCEKRLSELTFASAADVLAYFKLAARRAAGRTE